MRCVDALCSPFSSASAQPHVIFQEEVSSLQALQHILVLKKISGFTHVLNGNSNIWQKYIYWEGWGDDSLRSVFWFETFGWLCQAVALLWGTGGRATAPGAVPGAPQGPSAALPCCCHRGRFTSQTPLLKEGFMNWPRQSVRFSFTPMGGVLYKTIFWTFSWNGGS